MTITTDQRILDAIAECDRFIAVEGPRSADLRPADMSAHLEFCRRHREKLIALLAQPRAQ
jgi:hypothetical protein